MRLRLQISSVQSRLTITVIIAALILGLAAMAFVYGLIPLWAVGLVSLGNMVGIALVVSAIRNSKPAKPQSEVRARTWLIWPAGLVVGATLGVIEAIQKGWTSDDTIGAIICGSLLVVLGFTYRKLRNKSSTP